MTVDSYRSALAHLYGLRRFGAQPGLKVIEYLLDALDHPERKFRAVHVAGSKGKGSVAALTAGILTAGGLRTGLFTSPHLRSYCERIQIDRQTIGKRAVTEGIARIHRLAAQLLQAGTIARPPTFFEVTTALAFDWFARERVDTAVVEVGLGGRLDATNVLHAPVAVLTTIELEHTDVLGSSLTAIAREKAGILHPGMRATVGELKAEPRLEIERAARSLGVPIWQLDREVRVDQRSLHEHGQRLAITTPHRTLTGIELPLLGNFQAKNAALAVAACDLFGRAIGREYPDAVVRRGLASTEWRGRLERVGTKPDLYVDVAHTPESARAVGQSLVELVPFTNPPENVVLFGCLRGKRVEEMFDELRLIASTVVLSSIRSDRSVDLDTLRRAARLRFPRVVVAGDASNALRLARAATAARGFTVALGSDYLIGEVLNLLEGTPSDEPDLSDPALRGPGIENPIPAAEPGRRSR